MRARATEMPTRRAGTPTTDSGLQEIPVGTFSRALQRLSVAAGTSTGVPPSEEVMPVSPSVRTLRGRLVGPTRPLSTPMIGYQGPMVPWVTLPALASTPVRMPLAAIPPYGGVTTQVDSTNRNDGGNGATRLSALYALVLSTYRSSIRYRLRRGGARVERCQRVSKIGTLSGQNAPILGIPTELQNAVKTPAQLWSVEDNDATIKGMDSTKQYDRLFTDTELDMLERGDSPEIQNEPEEYSEELEER
ncbi:hypothetical protein PPTG_11548 [Phytophthora nicotianae INRA-310]|uniref:Uncharacterized protein n=1 Tax=Phytophthora nicotianae (strain INRA-310) TaxID=761204 RepID=W2Q6C3_PHYN3|nr:hypothetical protein PPTG_11548 [Phytophthora nicotianae INRA-310]ETN08707.1 hypothetical protein PPTG_11548 [Phytophthora nicotianae INRA-310]